MFTLERGSLLQSSLRWWLTHLVSVALAVSAAGCGGEDSLEQETSSPPESSATEGVARSIIVDVARDTSISNSEPNQNRGLSRYLTVSAGDAQRTLIAFDDAAVRDAVWTNEIVSAKVELSIASIPRNLGATGTKVSLYALTSPWTEWVAMMQIQTMRNPIVRLAQNGTWAVLRCLGSQRQLRRLLSRMGKRGFSRLT